MKIVPRSQVENVETINQTFEEIGKLDASLNMAPSLEYARNSRRLTGESMEKLEQRACHRLKSGRKTAATNALAALFLKHDSKIRHRPEKVVETLVEAARDNQGRIHGMIAKQGNTATVNSVVESESRPERYGCGRVKNSATVTRLLLDTTNEVEEATNFALAAIAKYHLRQKRINHIIAFDELEIRVDCGKPENFKKLRGADPTSYHLNELGLKWLSAATKEENRGQFLLRIYIAVIFNIRTGWSQPLYVKLHKQFEDTYDPSIGNLVRVVTHETPSTEHNKFLAHFRREGFKPTLFLADRGFQSIAAMKCFIETREAFILEGHVMDTVVPAIRLRHSSAETRDAKNRKGQRQAIDLRASVGSLMANGQNVVKNETKTKGVYYFVVDPSEKGAPRERDGFILVLIRYEKHLAPPRGGELHSDGGRTYAYYTTLRVTAENADSLPDMYFKRNYVEAAIETLKGYLGIGRSSDVVTRLTMLGVGLILMAIWALRKTELLAEGHSIRGFTFAAFLERLKTEEILLDRGKPR